MANSSMIDERFCTTAQNPGAEVRTFTLNDLNFRGCQGCMAAPPLKCGGWGKKCLTNKGKRFIFLMVVET
jgi:multimeric flavodoxin WrbA